MNKISDNQSDLDKRKGMIFAYFLGITWIISALNTIQNLYLTFTLNAVDAQEYAHYNFSNIGFLIILGLVWWSHRWYPRLMRHLFVLMLAVGAIVFFDLQEFNGLFIILTLPIIMAAFLIHPVYSFVYYLLIVIVYFIRLYSAGFSIYDEKVFPFLGLISLTIFAVVSWLIAQSLEKALAETRALNKELDQRVQDRTRELAEALERERSTAVRNTTILESIADGVLFFDAQQRVMIANPAVNQLAQQDLHLSTLTDILTTVEEKARELIKTWIMGQKPVDQNNVKFEWHDQTISATIAPVILPVGGWPAVNAGTTFYEILPKRPNRNGPSRSFWGWLADELRTPMSAIKGYVKVLLDTEKQSLSEDGYEYLQTIDGSIKQLLTLANELIDLSRLETGEVDLYREWIDLVPIVKQAVKMVQQEFAARNLTLEVKLADNLAKLYLDRNRILQVLLNLLSNAYKYTAQGGATVAITQSDEWMAIVVKDTGVR
ncbi:MAG: HAMP domain-containing sensor histidine kinase [Anaerolineae bacterium]